MEIMGNKERKLVIAMAANAFYEEAKLSEDSAVRIGNETYDICDFINILSTLNKILDRGTPIKMPHASYYCPVCHIEFETAPNFCDVCGQAFEWERE